MGQSTSASPDPLSLVAFALFLGRFDVFFLCISEELFPPSWLPSAQPSCAQTWVLLRRGPGPGAALSLQFAGFLFQRPELLEPGLVHVLTSNRWTHFLCVKTRTGGFFLELKSSRLAKLSSVPNPNRGRGLALQISSENLFATK